MKAVFFENWSLDASSGYLTLLSIVTLISLVALVVLIVRVYHRKILAVGHQSLGHQSTAQQSLSENRSISDEKNLDNLNLVNLAKSKPWLAFFAICFANTLMLTTLIILVLPIVESKHSKSQATLFTKGASFEKLEAVLKSNNVLEADPANRIYLTHDFVKEQVINAQHELFSQVLNHTELVKVPEQIASKTALSTNILIEGDGLTVTELQFFEHHRVRFNPAPKKSGVISPSWQRSLLLGQALWVSGKYQNENVNRIVNIALFDEFDQQMSSQKVKANETFALKAEVKTTGYFRYQLKILDNKEQVLSSETLAFTVEESPKIRLFIKQSAPSFESKQLKNWVSEQGGAVYVQTQISKERYISQKVNLDKSLEINKNNMGGFSLTSNLLRQFDVLVMDGRAVIALSAEEIVSINTSVSEGLGLLIMSDNDLIEFLTANELTTPKNIALKQLLSGFVFHPINSRSAEITARVGWNKEFAVHQLKQQKVNLGHTKAQVLAFGSDNQALVSKKNFGTGNIAISILNTTFEWQTQGESLAYSRYWQNIFQKIARNNQGSYWQPQNEGENDYIDKSSIICARLTGANITSNDLHLVENIDDRGQYCSQYWPKRFGWNQLTLSNEKGEIVAKQSRFAYSSGEWLVDQQSNKHKATMQAHLRSNKSNGLENSLSSSNAVITKTPINKMPIWLLFFACSSFLWVERKISN